MKKEVILITGANGMVAKNLSSLLSDAYHLRFLTRKKVKNNDYLWDLKTGYIDAEVFKNIDHIIHLAGAGIVEKRWTKSRKKTILSSRVNTARLILHYLQKYQINITSFISASAIGYYGTQTTDIVYTEKSKRGTDFLSDICFEWEKVAKQFKASKVSEREVIFRVGIILSKNGGVLKKMIPPVKLSLGSLLSSGNQYMPWIHIDDLCSMIKYSIENCKISGTFNAVSPEHITNKDFTIALAKYYNKSIFLPNIPSWIIKLMFGESSILLLKGSRVSSKKIMDKGFKFKHLNLKNALQTLLIGK